MSNSSAVNAILKLAAALDAQDVPSDDRYVIVWVRLARPKPGPGKCRRRAIRVWPVALRL